MNETLQRALSEIPWGVWVFLVLQGATILVWGVRIDGRVSAVEQSVADTRAALRALETDHRIMHGKIVIIEERQNRVIETNQYQQRQIDYVIQWFSPHATPPGPLPTPTPQRPNEKP